MKRFIIRTSKFVLYLSLIISVFYAVFFLRNSEKYHLDKSNIIIGDSNTRWGINDSILSNYQNYSTGGETYLFAYTKLKMLDRDNRIDTLLLSFNPHNLINNQWYDDSKMTSLQNRMPYFFSNFTIEDHSMLLKKMPKNYFFSLIKIGKPNLEKLLYLNREDKMFKFGSFSPVKSRNTNDTIFSKNQIAEVNETELLYLKKIKQECKLKNIKLIFIQTPKNKLTRRYVNYDFKEFYKVYQQELGDIDFLDFSKMNIRQDYFWDIYHLNDRGADYFTTFLKERKIKNLLNSKFNQNKNPRLSH